MIAAMLTPVEYPFLCTFMIQLGRYEELGSVVRRVNQYLPHYAPGAGKPVFEDGDMFKVIVPLAAEIEEDTPQDTPQVLAVLRALTSESRTREE
jgi:ATP-dependent DNA helicase RecG